MRSTQTWPRVAMFLKPRQPGGQTATPGYSATSTTSNDYEPTGNRYLGALVLLAAIIPLPFLASLITLIAYLSPSSFPAVALFQWLGSSNLVIILGLIITLVLWLLLAIPCKYFATAEGGRPSDYASLQRNYNVLSSEFEQVGKCDETRDIATDIHFVDIQSNLMDIGRELKRKGLPWVSYAGYVSMWDRINKVDEAMVGVLPCETVIESVNYDELSLKDSDVPESKELLSLLHEATNTLNKVISTLSSDSKGPKQSSAANNGQVSQQREQKARANIRKVKSALHKFTNERWNGLVRARNQLMGTAFLTAFFTYILVIIAILTPLPRENTIDAMVFYLLGAIVGLFGRLFDERNADKVIDDYGLGTIRIIVTPLISGLAVLVGILFVTTSSTIDTIYKITLQNLVFASILGFAPNILINTLQNKSEEIKGQIKGASPSDQKSGKGGSGSSKGNTNAGSV